MRYVQQPMKVPVTWAALFDWDGVIIDSSRYHELSWEFLAREQGLQLQAGHFKRGFGMKNEVIIPQVLGWAREPEAVSRLADKKETIYRQLIREQGIAPIAGVVAWLGSLRAASVPGAIASSTERANIDCVMDQIKLESHFKVIVSGDEVTHGKPDPAIFLLAAERLSMAPNRCVVFEDARVGIEAARTAGMRVVAVTTTHPAEELKDADLIVNRLDQLDLDTIASWFS